tara:strand:+ start:1067 stop:1468 length:402 start_codon:yes stop_codon:yes gene_type:complete
MASISTRLSVRSRNLFTNAIGARHDKTFNVTSDADRRIKTVKEASGSPALLIDASDYYTDTDITLFVFLKNGTSTNGKNLFILIGSQIIARIKPGEYLLLPWHVTSASADLKVYSNDATNGVKIEYFAAKMST